MKTATVADTSSHLLALPRAIAVESKIAIDRRGKQVVRLPGEPQSAAFHRRDLPAWVAAAPATARLVVGHMLR